MNTRVIFFTVLASTSVLTGLRAQAPDQFKDERAKSSYAIGMYYGGNWKKQDWDLDLEQIARGMKDGLGGKTIFTEPEMKEILDKFTKDLQAKQLEKRKAQGEKSKKEGEEFLAANKSKAGIVVTESGLQYKVIAEGAGDIPKATDTVTVNYRGTLIDGTEFDSSASHGKPASFRVTGVIPGWTEALTKMKTGAKWQLFIPSGLAYGENGPPKIGPNAVLIFDVELLSIQPPPPPPSPAAPLTSDIIKVPSLEEMKKGAQIETIKAEDVEKLQKQQQEQQKQQKPK